ncbi:cyclase family protein [Lichenifustis flavocetrariae]|uniref:Cyclase family protein n=1 Tax=Lichenifustis flavocetrariae TaxID=2949735 RepID=A0AA41Z2K4_9HYPH|nr:cyclase family protein [Lichenifustis flavocetrariae]MCW6511827.1 cyclase family protein [Lichenifustis flavocetrariae]
MAVARPNPIVDVVDLSHEIREGMLNMGGWTTAFPVIDTLAKTRTLSQGKMGVASRMILVSEHNGTHIDVPRHFVDDGAAIDEVPLTKLLLPGHLLDFTQKGHGEAITVADFEAAEERSGQRVGPGTALVCWTGVDKFWGRPDMNRLRPYVPAETAMWMVERQVSLFATDLVGMDNPDEWWEPTHLAWLSNGICMVQQLCNLDQLVGKTFLFQAFPMKTVGGTGCPVRAAALVLGDDTA